MQPSVSLTSTHFFFEKNTTHFTIPVNLKNNILTDCSVSVCLSGSSLLNPAANQYNGVDRTLAWRRGENGIQYAQFQIIDSSNEIEYLQVFLTNFLRCEAGQISHANIALGSTYYPTIFGGYITLDGEIMQRKVTQQQDIYTTKYSFDLPSDAVLGEVRNSNGEFLQPPLKKIVRTSSTYQAVIEIMDSEPVIDKSLQIYIVLL